MAAEVHSIEDIISAQAQREASRPLYTFQLPKLISQETGVKSIGMVELTTNEMSMAQVRGGDNRLGVGFELAKASWRRVDDRVLSIADGTVDIEWGRVEAGWSKLRTLLLSAYADIHNPKTEENEAFLATRTVSVGR